MEKSMEISGTLREIIGAIQYFVSHSIHYNNNPFALCDECSIDDNAIAVTRRTILSPRPLLQGTLNDASDAAFAMSTLLGQLTNAVAFNDPSIKPDEFSCILCCRVLPNERMSTVLAVPSLTLERCCSIALNIG
jgi:hypothetical protein